MPKQNILIVVLCFATLCFALFNLAGCGTKGPLYIPEQRYPQGAEKAPVTPPASQPNKE